MKKTSLLLISLLLWIFASCSNNNSDSAAQIDATKKDSTELCLTAQFFVKPEHVEDFKALTVDLIANTRKEKGEVFYNLYQSVEDPTAFIFYERFENRSAFDYHLTTEHYKKFAEAIKSLISKETEVKIMN